MTGYAPAHAGIGILLAVAIFTGNASAEQAEHVLSGPLELVWETRNDSSSYNVSRAVAVSPDGSTVFVAGHAFSRTTGDDYCVEAYAAASGERIWANDYATRGFDHAMALAVSPDGQVLAVTGKSWNRWSWVTLLFDAASGERLWASVFRGRNPGDGATAVEFSVDGSTIFVAGTWASDFATLAYDVIRGDLRWLRRLSLHQGSTERPTALATSPDGTMLFVAESDGSNAATIAIEASTGHIQWSRLWDGVAEAHGLTISSDGESVYLIGGEPYATARLDALDGDTVWQTFGPTNGKALDLVVAADESRVFVTGESTGGPGAHNLATYALDALTGDALWAAQANGFFSDDCATGIAVSSDGSIIHVAADSLNGASKYYTFYSYAAPNGSLVARDSYERPGTAIHGLRDIAVQPTSGTVYVTGERQGFATLAYSIFDTVFIRIEPAGNGQVDLSSRGVVTVVVLGSAVLDTTAIDVATLRFGPRGSTSVHALDDPFEDNSHRSDLNLDGHADLTVHFQVEKTGLACGDRSATLRGSTSEGRHFEGSSALTTIGCITEDQPHHPRHLGSVARPPR